MTLAEGCLVHKNVSYERLSLGYPAYVLVDSVLYPETSRLYMARRLRNSHFGGTFLRFSPHVSAICK